MTPVALVCIVLRIQNWLAHDVLAHVQLPPLDVSRHDFTGIQVNAEVNSDSVSIRAGFGNKFV